MTRFARFSTPITLWLFSMHPTSAGAIQVDQSMIDDARADIEQVCPVRWQEVSTDMAMPAAGESLWQDDADEAAFSAYLTDIDPTVNIALLIDDPAAVGAECGAKRTALLDLMLAKEPNDLLMALSVIKDNAAEAVQLIQDGSSPEQGAESCNMIKQGFPDAQSGAYWLDVTGGDSSDAVQAYCEMNVDGGGWTLVAHTSGATPDHFFTVKSGNYSLSRSTYVDASLGIMGDMDDTQMMITIDTPDPVLAKTNNAFVRYHYDSTAPMFNTGPSPCTPSAFTYSLELDGSSEQIGTTSTCTGSYWFLRGSSGEDLIMLRSIYGFFWGAGVGGNSTWTHNAWVYVR